MSDVTQRIFSAGNSGDEILRTSIHKERLR